MTAIEEAACGEVICNWFRGDKDNLIQKLHGASVFTDNELGDELDFLFEFEMTRREMALEAKHEL